MPDERLIEGINQKRIKEYSDENRLRSDASHEQGSERDYGGRFLVELLQNADDAMSDPNTTASDLIGCKGLGFISVFEVTKVPEVYSGSFHFRFSPTETHKAIKDQHGFDSKPDFTGLIPHEIPIPEEVLELLEKHGYATVIRLPIGLKSFQKIKDSLVNFDHRLLLLCQRIRKIEIDISGESRRTFNIEDRPCDGLPEGKVYMHINGEPRSYYCWSKTETSKDNSGKRSSASICLPCNQGNDGFEVMPDAPPLHVFFPTEERLPYHALIHISLDLEQNRKHVREDIQSQNQNEHAMALFQSLIGKMAEDVPAEVLLQALVPDSVLDDGAVANRLWSTIQDVLSNKCFIPVIGGKCVVPPSTKIWKHGLGDVLNAEDKEIALAHLASPAVNSFKSKLQKLGATTLPDEEYPLLLAGCINTDAVSCQRVINVIHKYFDGKHFISDDELQGFRKVPCWWLASTTTRALITQNTQSGAFLSTPKQPPPEWLKIDVLDKSFQNKWSALSENSENWKKLGRAEVI